jgi:DNA-binding beta-propeller fold protein YncE
LTSFGEGELSTPYGIAVDQTDGDVYISDAADSRIVRYTVNADDPPTYNLDPTYLSPAQGSKAEAGQIGDFASPIAIDPASGDLIVADTGNLQIARFAHDGTFVSSFNGASFGISEFESLQDLAVAPGSEIYVIRDGELTSTGVVAQSRLERFAADGTSGQLLEGGAGARSLAFDSHLDNLIVAAGGGSGRPELWPRIIILHDGEVVESVAFPAEVGGDTAASAPVGLASDGGPSGRLYALTDKVPGYGKITVQVFSSLSVPILEETSGVMALGAYLATAHLLGTVNPIGKAATYHFEYSANGGSTWAATPVAAAGEGTQPVAVQADIPLMVDRDYLVRLVIASGGADASSAPRTFSSPHTPLPATLEAGPLDINSTVLKGTVNPRGLASTYRFEYGTSDAYGFQTAAIAIGAGDAVLGVSEVLSGLQPGTLYHFRIVAESLAGARAGADRTFTTRPADPIASALPSALESAFPAVQAPARRRCAEGRRRRQINGHSRCVRHHKHRKRR